MGRDRAEPVYFRVGDLSEEIRARRRAKEKLAGPARRDLSRFYAACTHRFLLTLPVAEQLLDELPDATEWGRDDFALMWARYPEGSPARAYVERLGLPTRVVLVDVLERARKMVERGITADAALEAVGLVASADPLEAEAHS